MRGHQTVLNAFLTSIVTTAIHFLLHAWISSLSSLIAVTVDLLFINLCCRGDIAPFFSSSASSLCVRSVSNIFPATASKHTGRKDEDKVISFPGFGIKATLAFFQFLGKILLRNSLLYMTKIFCGIIRQANFHVSAMTPSGPGAFPFFNFFDAHSSSSSVLICCVIRPFPCFGFGPSKWKQIL